MSFRGKAIGLAKFGAAAAITYGAVQGAGEIGQMTDDSTAGVTANAGTNMIACINAEGMGDSAFMLDGDGLIAGIDLAPADQGRETYAGEACDPWQFAGQVALVSESLRTDSNMLLQAANRQFGVSSEAEQGDSEGDYQNYTLGGIIALYGMYRARKAIRNFRNRRASQQDDNPVQGTLFE